ncbi:MAG: hypothetical protein ACREBE_08745, partial [bacterium]
MILPAAVLPAQSNACPGGGQSPLTIAGAQSNATKDACTQVVDVFQFLAPQLGLALAGGNATLGQGGTLGGIGHFSIGVRGNAFQGDLPQVQNFPAPSIAQTQTSKALPSDKQFLGLPVVDAAIGIFQGIPLGLTNVGGLDLLLSAAFIPSWEGDGVSITPESNFKFGFGARLGLLQESLVVPGIAVTYIKRDLPTTTIAGTSTNLDFTIEKAAVNTSAWRIVANKNLILFGIAAGFGQDKYDQSTTLRGTAKSIPTALGQVTQQFGPISLSQDVKRTNMFVDLSANLAILKVVGEVGRVSGADPEIKTFNS